MALDSEKDGKLSRLESAKERFEAAAGKLEKALEVSFDEPNKGDIEKLTAESAALRTENEKLSKLNRAVGERLDGAIDRLKTALEA